MRLITGISIATLAASITALPLVLWLVVTEPWESDAANKGHTQELAADTIKELIHRHASQLIESEGLTHLDDLEAFSKLPGYGCFWTNRYWESQQIYSGHPETFGSDSVFLNYNYIEKCDIWLVTSINRG